ncbi:MAG: hypothetical protein JXR71_09580 [Bacteroidales bacterium]|nr:hypothetical protein [Bacteroidales bacterium]
MKRRINKSGWGIFTLALLLSWGTTQAQISFSVSNKIPKYIDVSPVYGNDLSATEKTQFSQWLNYTTLVEYHEPSFTVSLQMRSKRIPSGMNVWVKTEPYQGYIKGAKGTVTGKIQLMRIARVLIDNITTCYTGSEAGEGHKINLSFNLPKRRNEDSIAYSITLVYTLTQ